jgi:hypothetical protein
MPSFSSVEMGSHKVFPPGWLETAILPISASQVARITGVSYCPGLPGDSYWESGLTVLGVLFHVHMWHVYMHPFLVLSTTSMSISFCVPWAPSPSIFISTSLSLSPRPSLSLSVPHFLLYISVLDDFLGFSLHLKSSFPDSPTLCFQQKAKSLALLI